MLYVMALESGFWDVEISVETPSNIGPLDAIFIAVQLFKIFTPPPSENF